MKWWCLAVTFAMLFLAGCSGSPPRLHSSGDIEAAPDSLGLADFMALTPETRAVRRERAVYWRRQADRRDGVLDRAQALNVATGFAPDDAESWLDLAEIWSWAGNHLQAEASLVAAAAAIRRFNDADYDLAVRGSERDAFSRRTALLRAWLHYDRAEWREGLDWAKAATQLGHGDEDALLVLGLLEASLQHRSQAHEIAEDLRRIDVFHTGMPWILAILDRAQGRYREAFDEIAQLRPERERACEAWRDMGMIAEHLGEWSYAERWYNESGAALPAKRGGYLRKASFRRLGPPDIARPMLFWLGFDRFYVTGSLSAYTAFALASFHEADTDADETAWGGAVVDAAGILLRREEDPTWARRARGLVFVQREHTDRGLADLSRAAREMGSVAGRDGRLQAGLGHAWLARRNHERALPFLRRGVILLPEDAEVRSDLGLALVMTDDEDGALAAFDRALELDPELATAWYNRGLLHLHAEELEQAEKDLAEAARLAPDHPDLGQLLQQVRQEIRRKSGS